MEGQSQFDLKFGAGDAFKDNEHDIVTIVSQDEKQFKLTMKLASCSGTISYLIDDCGVDNPIKLIGITAEHFDLFVTYYNKLFQNPDLLTPDPLRKPWELPDWKAEFVKGFEFQKLFALTMAANYLEAKNMFAALTKACANYLRDKTPDQVCEAFGVKNDFTPEQLEQVRKENPWIDEE
jgi:S-phase kinase-associated protein 1